MYHDSCAGSTGCSIRLSAHEVATATLERIYYIQLLQGLGPKAMMAGHIG